MKNNYNVLGHAWNFIKRNAAYLILVLCLLAIGLSVTLVVVNSSKNFVDLTKEVNSNVDTEDVSDIIEPEQKPEVTFTMPVANFTSVGEFSDTMVFNSTLNRFSAHLGIDFFADEGSDVLCVSDGVVKSVDNSILTGITVTIDHGNGLISVYNSLGDADGMSVGQKLKTGDKIGTVSVTNRQEYKDGAHLHFEMRENGVNVDPEKYLTFNNK